MKGRADARERVATVPAFLGWLPLGLVAVAIVITYARVAPAELYHVSGTGAAGGLGRALVFLNFPVALAALPLIPLAAERLGRSRLALASAVVAAALCALVAWPGVVDQANLDAKPVNALPAAGVALTVVLVAAAGLFRAQARVDLVLAGLVLFLLVLAIPWIAADAGFFVDGVPVLGSIFLSGKVVSGHAAVHHGHHHGMDGLLLVLAALATIPVLRQARAAELRIAVAMYLGLQLAYGLANFANDAWLEQVVKRGWTSVEIPNVLRPAVSIAWLGIAVAAVVFSILVRRRATRWAAYGSESASSHQPTASEPSARARAATESVGRGSDAEAAAKIDDARAPGHEPPRLGTRVPPYSAETHGPSQIGPTAAHSGGTR
jgi:hypothetical protein